MEEKPKFEEYKCDTLLEQVLSIFVCTLINVKCEVNGQVKDRIEIVIRCLKDYLKVGVSKDYSQSLSYFADLISSFSLKNKQDDKNYEIWHYIQTMLIPYFKEEINANEVQLPKKEYIAPFREIIEFLKSKNIESQINFVIAPCYLCDTNVLKSLDPNMPSGRILRNSILFDRTIKMLEDIKKNHNHSLYQEIRNIAEKNNGMEKIAIDYRGHKITYREMFEKTDQLAKSFSAMGLEKGDEIICCFSNTPEMFYILLAASRMGLIINSIGSSFNKEYLKEIMSRSFVSSKLFIGSDVEYTKIKELVDSIPFENIILYSLKDSLPKDDEGNIKIPLENIQFKELYGYENHIPNLQNDNDRIISLEEFMKRENEIEVLPKVECTLDTLLTITYTSGSTSDGCPKGIEHTNGSYIIEGSFNNSEELTGSPRIVNLRSLVHIPPHSNTSIQTGGSDNLIKGGTVCPEPEYSEEKALEYLSLNKVTLYAATTSHLIKIAKMYYSLPMYKRVKIKMPWLLVPMAVGERLSIGEEKFINTFLKDVGAGTGVKFEKPIYNTIMPTLFSIAGLPISIGGGQCEFGGIFYTLMLKTARMTTLLTRKSKEVGMKPVPFAITAALKKLPNGQYEECEYGEEGIIAARSPINMKRYHGDIQATKNIQVKDKNGNTWILCGANGYVNSDGYVVMKGRLDDKIVFDKSNSIHCFEIDDIINDIDGIMSCTTVKVKNNDTEIPVINIEFSPFLRNDDKKRKIALLKLEKQLRKKIKDPYFNKLYFRLFGDNNIEYPLTHSGKRSAFMLQKMGLSNTFQLFNGNMYYNQQELEEAQKKFKNRTLKSEAIVFVKRFTKRPWFN